MREVVPPALHLGKTLKLNTDNFYIFMELPLYIGGKYDTNKYNTGIGNLRQTSAILPSSNWNRKFNLGYLS